MTPLSLSHISGTSRQTDIAALFDVDNTLLPGQASEVRFFRFLWKRGLVGCAGCGIVLAGCFAMRLRCHCTPCGIRKLYLAGKAAAEVESLAEEFCRAELVGGARRGSNQTGAAGVMPGHVDALAALAPAAKARRRITDAEVREIIRAYRRHVPVAEIARTLGRGPAAVYMAVGAWAMREERLDE